MRPKSLMLALLLSATSLLTACGPKPLKVVPDQPPRSAKIAVPAVVSDPVKHPSWWQ